MKKSDILRRLQELDFDPTQYWIITGAAMVLYGIRAETGDIDMGCTTALADLLEARGYPTVKRADGSHRITIGDDVEIFENWLYDKVECYENIPLLSPQGLIEMKRFLGREKDLRDIALIEDWRRAMS